MNGYQRIDKFNKLKNKEYSGNFLFYSDVNLSRWTASEHVTRPYITLKSVRIRKDLDL